MCPPCEQGWGYKSFDMDNNVGYDQKTWGWDAGTGQSNFGGNRNRLGEAIRRVANIGTLLRIDNATVSSHCRGCRLFVCLAAVVASPSPL